MKKFKKAAALIIVIAWGILLLTTLITAFIDNETAHTLFKGLIFTDIVLPIVAYDAYVQISVRTKPLIIYNQSI